MAVGTSNFQQVASPSSTSVRSGQTMQIYHPVEVPADLSPTTSFQSVTVPPSRSPVTVESRVYVQTAGARGLRSPEYVAGQRRKRIGKIRAQIEELASHSGASDFTSFTFPIVDDLQKTIKYLDDFQELEGNCSAVLRQLRNTFFDGGWNAYRSDPARNAASEVFATLLADGPVEAEAVKNSFGVLFRAGLRPFLPVPMDDFEEETDGGDE